jgi:MshEN domain
LTPRLPGSYNDRVPRDLAALLVEEGAVSEDALERARARQREAGGGLDTALLEEGAIDEEALVGYLARASGLPAVGREAWDADDPHARRVFPGPVAGRHALAPLALRERELTLATAYPPDLAQVEDISFMLSLHLAPQVGPEWRVRERIHRLYGLPLDARLAALATAARRRMEASAAPAGEPGPAPDGGGFDTGAAPWDAAAADGARGSAAPDAAAQDVPAPATGPEGTASAPGGAFHRERGGEVTFRAPEEPDTDPEAIAAAFAEAIVAGAREPDGGAVSAASEDGGPPPDRSAPPGWSLEEARSALAAATTRDEVLLVALRYARDFFPCAATFVVARDAIAGHDALGPEEHERDACRATAIWASDPGIFRTVLENGSPYLGPPTPAPGTDAILQALGRGTPRTVLAQPIAVRDRAVAILYADSGDQLVPPGVGDLLLAVSTAGMALERIVLARKRARADPDAWAARDPHDLAGRPRGPRREPQEWSATEPGRGGAPVIAAREERPDPTSAAVATSIRTRLPTPTATPTAPPTPTSTSRASPDLTEVEIDLDLGDFPSRLADRALDADPAVAADAHAALAALPRSPRRRLALEKLRRALVSSAPPLAARAAKALGAVREGDAIPLLVQALDAGSAETARAAAAALEAITLQRLGADAQAWVAWWKENRGRRRADWLLAALTSEDRETRAAAAAELTQIAPAPIPYSADLPPAQRDTAARAWAEAWARSGHVL